MTFRLNIGCGQTPTLGPDWLNFDGSPTVRLVRLPIISRLALLLLDPAQRDFFGFCQTHDIRYADATKRIPVPDRSADVLYSSHMLEHLTRQEARRFLSEARRILVSGGIIRLAVPDLWKHVGWYIVEKDGDEFMRSIQLGRDTVSQKTRLAQAIFGDRGHKWFYDGSSLIKLLTDAGFCDASVWPAGQTMIPAPAQLDLSERADISVFAEARCP
jgi:predicted SAM-dependent methyltransferase